jgi:hypothetical protein
MRFSWRRDVGALSRNNAIVQHCYVSFATQRPIRNATQQCSTLLRTRQWTRRETISMVTRLLSADFCWFVELVRIERLWKMDAHMCLESS